LRLSFAGRRRELEKSFRRPGRSARHPFRPDQRPGKARLHRGDAARIFRSDDAGATWSDKTKGLPSKEIVCFAGASKDKLVMLYCAVPSKNDGGKFSGGV